MPRKGRGSKVMCYAHKTPGLWGKHWWAKLTLNRITGPEVSRFVPLCENCDTATRAEYGEHGSVDYYLPVDAKTHEFTKEARKKFDARKAQFTAVKLRKRLTTA